MGFPPITDEERGDSYWCQTDDSQGVTRRVELTGRAISAGPPRLNETSHLMFRPIPL